MPIGKLEPFDLNSQKWPAYIRRVRQYIVLNEIKDELIVPLLITVVGEATYSLMCDLSSPAHPETKTFDALVDLVAQHLEPQRSEIAERHVFRLRRQRIGETLTDYLQSLKHLATTCNFGNGLEENLRDQFVSGLANEAMRSRIFAEKNIKYKEAVELALALEAAERHAEVSGATAVATQEASGTSGSGADEGLHQASARRGGRGARGGAEPACWRCGKAHRPDRCRFVNYNCDRCNKRGHLKVMCKVRGSDRSFGRQNFVSEPEDVTDDEDIFNIELMATGTKPFFIKVNIDGFPVECEIDTGSRISAISELFYKQHFMHKPIIVQNIVLRSYAGSPIESLGSITVNVTLGHVTANNLELHVIKNGSRPLLGREWIRALNIKQINFNEIRDDSIANRLANEFPEVFTSKLGTCKKTIKLELTDSKPVYVRARPVPLALRARVQAELERLEAEGTIYRVEHSEYGTPIVPVVKESGDIRICGDYKVTINPKLKREFYPLPRIEELFATLSGGEEFSKIDLTHAYAQTMLTEDSQPYTAITTHLGTFVYRRTPYGLSCIPEKFQKLMEETLKGVPNTVVFLDDIAVTGATRATHLCNLRQVLVRLKAMGLTVKMEKCIFLKESVKYLGFIIDKKGLHPDPMKVAAITRAPRPIDVTQLKSFLGILNYYGKFIPNLSIMLHPLLNLLKKGMTWNWSEECERAFNEAKQILASDRVLAHYEEGRPLVLSVDSSAYGVGAVLAHCTPDGERPISCASRTLNDAEKNYSQLDKEALAIFFGVTRHHHYLFGRQFMLRTDHQPLSYIFGPKQGIPQTAASRLQRWAVRLAAYDFKIVFVRSSENGPADALSRLPLSNERRCATQPQGYMNVVIDNVPVDFRDVSKQTKDDVLLSKILGYVKFGWPSHASCEEEKPYFERKKDIVSELGCLIYKYRIIIPPKLRKNVLEEIHEGHLGINKMKNLSRNYVYWPGLDSDLENICRTCEACRAVRDAPPRAAVHPWEYPLLPWQRIHADFGDYAGKRYLIIVDAHSKWIEVITMTRSDASSTITAFRSVFARFGLPAQLVTDNGPPFFSLEFKSFCSQNFIRHVTSAPYRPQGNGAAENAVKTIKKAIKRAVHVGEDIEKALSVFLFSYRNCEHATTGVSPAVLMLGRRLRNRLDALRPDLATVVRAAQQRQIANAKGTTREIGIGEPVLVRNYSTKGNKWEQGTVTERTGPVSYKVGVGKGVEWRRHHDQILPVKDKSRFSLTQTNLSSSREKDPAVEVEDDADEFEDAAEAGSEDRGQVTETSKPDLESTTSPEPNASARALRAINRANRK